MFNLKITITGVCAFVPLKNENDYKYCVVMPSTDTDRLAVDGEPLCPHESFIEQGFGFDVARRSLARLRLWFETDPPNGDLSLAAATNNTPGLAYIRDAYASAGSTASEIVSRDKTPPPHIRTQVFLRDGEPDYRLHDDWYFEYKASTFKLAHQVAIYLNNLDTARAVLQPLSSSGNADRTYIDLTPDDGRTVRLLIVNTCARGGGLPAKQSKIDRDFKWYYELLKDRPPESDADLPVPRRESAEFIRGSNCIPSLLDPPA
ncbi:MAG: hypothetical protein M3O15_07615 [Acidobacteriota bacterium]|nr:hypothetical protein [Acidobacteriota bacterium]